MTWLLAWTAIKNGAGAAFGWIARWPWQTACAALLLASLWFLHGRTDARAELARHIAAEKAATGAQKRINDAATHHYEEAANAADNKHDAMVNDAFDLTAAYVAQHRVQPEGGACKAPAPAASGDPEVSKEPAASSVVVAQADVETCAADYTYARSAYEWAQSLKLPENLLPGE